MRRWRRLCGGDAGGVDDAFDLSDRLAVLTSASTDGRDDTSTAAVLTSNPASLRTFATASAVSIRRSANTTCLPTLTRRAIAWPINPVPMTTTTLVMTLAEATEVIE